VSHRLLAIASRIDPGLLLALILSLAASWPFLFRSSLPRETDAELHVFRAAELGYSLRAFDLYPRWAPDFYYGYGYPIFNYYAPFSYYLANIASLAIKGGAVFGVKAVFILGFVLAGCGSYLLGRLYTGPGGGVIATSSYLFSPYFYLIDPHLRGDLAEFFALGVAPLTFWAIAKYQQAPTRGHLATASALITALLLSHNLLGLLFFGMLVLFVLWNRLASRDIRRLWFDLLPLGLAVGLSAFFWLPVTLESSAVQLHNLVGPGHFDYRNHFVSIAELFAPSLSLDLGALNPAFRFNLGIAQWLLAVIGLCFLGAVLPSKSSVSIRTTPSLPAISGFFWPLCGLSLIFLITSASLPVWDAVPQMAFLQFPWRLLGPATICLALMGAQSVRLLDQVTLRFQSAVLVGAVALPIFSALPFFVPPAWGQFGSTDQNAMLDFELHGLALGTTSTGDFVPSTIDLVPAPNPDLINSYRQGDLIDRVNRQTLPPDSRVEIARQRPTDDIFHVQSHDQFVLRLYRFMFPGWKATVDGEPAEIEVAQPEGFITVVVPPGDHIVRVWLGLTSVRLVASFISLLTLALMIALDRLLRPKANPIDISQPLNLKLVGIGIAGVLLLTTLFAIAGIMQPHSTGLIPKPAEQSTHEYVEGGIDLIGYDVPKRAIQPGDPVDIVLYWKARESVPANYQVFIHLTTIPEHTWAQSDKLNPGDFPTTRWPLDKYVRDPHSFVLPLGTPPGEYILRVGLWDQSTGRRQLILAKDGTILGDSIALPTKVAVAASSSAPAFVDLPYTIQIGQHPIEGLTLIGAELQPGLTFKDEIGLLTIDLYWRADQANLSDLPVAVRLVDSHGEVVAHIEGSVTDGLHPFSTWKQGEIVRDIHSLWLDTNIPTRDYEVQIAIIRKDTPANWLTIATLHRELPEQ